VPFFSFLFFFCPSLRRRPLCRSGERAFNLTIELLYITQLLYASPCGDACIFLSPTLKRTAVLWDVGAQFQECDTARFERLGEGGELSKVQSEMPREGKLKTW